jgi:hypothetical protein
MDCLTLEIIAEREVPQHLEERMMVGRPAHVFDIAGTQTLLARRSTLEFRIAQAEKLAFELIHPGGREQDRLVFLRDKQVARPTLAPLGLEKSQKRFT